ncbi:MAG: glycoside hydrolase family 9 protein, partial [Verrucomicrobiota bacterium]
VVVCSLCLSLMATSAAAEGVTTNEWMLALPKVGEHRLRIISPTVLELTLVQTKAPDPARVAEWDFVNSSQQYQAPAPFEFEVRANFALLQVQSVGFKRRVLYAPLAQRDLRIGSHLYLVLSTPIAEGQTVEVKNPGGRLWPASRRFVATAAMYRHSPAVHVNQGGYMPGFPKKAMVGYFLGNLGELPVPEPRTFRVVVAGSLATAFTGTLRPRADVGYVYQPTPYQQVWEADFSQFNAPGEFLLVVPGLGASLPFRIHDGAAMGFARAYALGMYHQRCGMGNALPHTRHEHGPCHTNRAEVPTMAFTFVNWLLGQVSADYSLNALHTAPQLKDVATSLYPFLRQGMLDVSGGHHDAGDYSKYTVNSAMLIHHLMFAVDSLGGAGGLDNLGIPESGDGISDLMQEAKWEADYLAKLQDEDGGFYFLVYPRDRRYENNVLPDQGDPQVVWPKNTAATAAAVAALAQCASSPRFREQYPAQADLYMQKAQAGWDFLINAVDQFGKNGAYQKLTHYGNEFMHNDELAWAAAEMYLATGDLAYHDQLLEWFPDPTDPATARWGWWRLFGSYGCAVRSYAFGARSGRVSDTDLDPEYLERCEAQLIAAGNDAAAWAQQSAYGTSFPTETKRVRGAGWYFSIVQAFDIAVAHQLDPRPEYVEAMLSNMNYEGGCNPLNVSYLTGMGWKRQREIVHQYAQNDWRVLPPSGFPLGNVQASFDYLDPYKSELGALSFPPDGAATGPYPYYDRWGDSFNVTTEFVVTDQARGLATLAYLAAGTVLAPQGWSGQAAQITGLPVESSINVGVTATLQTPGLDLSEAQIVWEASGHEPAFGSSYVVTPTVFGPHRVEVEAVWPDGRRVFAATNFVATNGLPTVTVTATKPSAVEGSTAPGEFSLARTGDTGGELTVTYRFSGTAAKFTDYKRVQGDMPEFVVIPAGASSATVSFLAVDDTIVEGPETVIVTVLPGATYNLGIPNQTTLGIVDNDIAITRLSISNGMATVTWWGVPGKTYRVIGKQSLFDTSWLELSGDVVAAEESVSWMDTTAVGNRQRFYRVYLKP